MPTASSRTLDLEAATRAATALAIPLVVLWAIGRLDLAVYASFGAFTSLYGRHEPYRVRLVSVTAAGIGLVLCISAGIVMACLGTPVPAVAAVLAAIIAIGVGATAVIGWIPGQPVFFVFGFLVCAYVPTTWEDAPPAVAVAMGSAALSWLICMSGWGLRRLGGAKYAHHFRALPRRPVRSLGALADPVVVRAAVVSVVGGLAAGAIALVLGLGHPYWAVVTVTAVMPLAYAPYSVSRAVHRMLGTVIGIVIAGVVLFAHPPAIVIIAFAVACQFVTELVVGRHYGAALVFITPLALTVSSLSVPVAVLPLLADRVIETFVGVAVAMALVITRRRWAARSPRSA